MYGIHLRKRNRNWKMDPIGTLKITMCVGLLRLCDYCNQIKSLEMYLNQSNLMKMRQFVLDR